MPADEPKGLIFDIQGHSLHDGPGTRTLIFLSGCPLRCRWCSNPEGLLLRQRLMFKQQLCRDCPARCVDACEKGAVRRPEIGGLPVVLDRRQCDGCDKLSCLKACYMGALQRSGKWFGVDEVMRLLNRDRSYWDTEGGVTLTGGEPLMQREFVLRLLRCCCEEHIGVCVETSAYVPRTVLEALLPHVDWLFVDIKHMDSTRHEHGTGVPNKPILDNLRWLMGSGWPGRLVLRMPVVPGFNDTTFNAEATAGFMREIGSGEINLLPFHRLGASKYAQLGTTYEYAEQTALGAEQMDTLASVYREKGITCHLAADTPF
jgi:pyruvate formate lyase activating enzyme